MRNVLAVSWGLSGVGLLLTSAVYRLTLRALTLSPRELHWYHWIALGMCILAMAYAEGYRGFQQRFSPRVASRARWLLSNADLATTLLAPLFLMGYFRAPLRRKLSSIGVTLGVVALVVLVHWLPVPWRPILDVGVVVGLSWGVVSLAYYSVMAFTSTRFSFPPEVA